MKVVMYWIVGSVLVLGLLTIGIALMPKGQPRVGLVSGHLSACPDSPNCVCSEDVAASATIAPLQFNDAVATAWQRARAAIIASGGQIQKEEPHYLWASFTTKWLRFVDDVELRLDRGKRLIHIRSASRVGHSDLGANRKRVAHIRAVFAGGG